VAWIARDRSGTLRYHTEYRLGWRSVSVVSHRELTD
jgi:hypothetical protein